MMFHWCLQVLISTVLIAWQAGLLWWRWAHLLIYSYCHCFPLSSPQDGYWLALWTLVCIFLSSESSSFLPSTTEDEDLIIPGTNSHQNRCRGTTEHVLGKSDPWCVISTSESSSEALAPVLSEAVWDALQKEKDTNFPGCLSALGDATSGRRIAGDMVSGTSHTDMKISIWQKRLRLAYLVRCPTSRGVNHSPRSPENTLLLQLQCALLKSHAVYLNIFAHRKRDYSPWNLSSCFVKWCFPSLSGQ